MGVILSTCLPINVHMFFEGVDWQVRDLCSITHLTVIQLAELLDDPLLQDESFPQLFPVVLDRHFALFLLHRVVAGDGSGANAADNSGRALEEDAAGGAGQRGASLGAGGRH